jgi:uncharacterized membrane protein
LFDNIHPNWFAIIAAVFVSMARVLYQFALAHLNPKMITVLVNVVSLIFAINTYIFSDGVEK